MPHNGGRTQIGLNDLQVGSDYSFLNHLKTAQGWSLVSGGTPAPDTLDSNGYPISISGGGVNTIFFIPQQSALTGRPGNYVCFWQGGGTVYRSFTGSIVAGSATNLVTGTWNGLEGRFETTITGTTATTGRIDLGISAIDVANPITDLVFCHEDDEQLIRDGEVFGVKFKEVLAENRFGSIRLLHWMSGNLCNLRYWADRCPVNYVYYGGTRAAPQYYGGVTTNSGDDYSVAAPSSWDGLVDKAMVVVRFNASATTDTPTLNVGGTGAKTIKDRGGAALASATRPVANFYGSLTYDADLDCWLKVAGDTEKSNCTGFDYSVPFELQVRLCEETETHPYFNQPMLAADPKTDFITGLATYCRDNGPSWMVPRFEGINELWNGAASFYGTRYGRLKAIDHWGSAGDTLNQNNFYGKTISDLGQDVSAVYSDDRSKYWVICGVHTALAPDSTQDPRLTSAEYVSDGGSAAKNWVTHIAPASYWGVRFGTATAELALAVQYEAADAEGKVALVDTAAATNSVTGVAPNSITRIAAWQTWGQGHDIDGCTIYEGGISPDYLTTNDTATISAISQAADGVIAVGAGDVKPPVGMLVSIFSVVGMTELNTKFFTSSGVDTSTNQITTTVTHSLLEDQPVFIETATAGGTLPSPLVTETVYYAAVIDTDTIQLRETPGGAAIDLTTTGSASNHILRPLYTVLDVTGNNITIDRDTSGLTAYGSSGFVNYVNSMDWRNNLRRATKTTPSVHQLTAYLYETLDDMGVESIAHYNLAGTGAGGAGDSFVQVWAMFEPDIYATSPQSDAVTLFNNRKWRFTLSTT
jgi:hypothetical protein